MNKVFERSKEFEYLTSTYDPLFNELINAIEIVKEFIIEHKLIIYGGSSIDYALRLCGDKIYPDDMLKIPDLDFYSPKNVEHSYMLADILFIRGYREVRAINAQHMETMRVDLANNHFIADITYRPPEIFESLPYLSYNGMRIIHPHFQRIDVHSSLSFPYDNVPREVIFERWSKDIKRFNKLAQYYPIKIDSKALINTRPVTVNGARKFVLTGFAAYAIIYDDYLKRMQAINENIPGCIIPSKLSFDKDSLTFDTINQICDVVNFDIEKLIGEMGLDQVKYYEPYINLLLKRAEGTKNNVKYVIYSTKNKLLAANSIRIGGDLYRITNIQFLLKYFLSMYFVTRQTPALASTYLSRYTSLLTMIRSYEEALVKENDDVNIKAYKSLLFPTVQTYGSDNINLAREIALNRLYSDLTNEPLYKIPANYYPSRSRAKNLGHPIFNPRDLEFFREDGKEIVM